MFKHLIISARLLAAVVMFATIAAFAMGASAAAPQPSGKAAEYARMAEARYQDRTAVFAGVLIGALVAGLALGMGMTKGFLPAIERESVGGEFNQRG